MNFKNKKNSQWEYIILGLFAVSYFISCVIVSNKKYLWNDELLSFYLLDDRSLLHMLSAWGDTFNQAPPLYFVFGWFWRWSFGNSELALRSFSSLAIVLSFLVIWIVLRRNYSFWVTSTSCLGTFCLAELLLYHNSEVRMYGLFTLACTLGFYQYGAINEQQNLSNKRLWINSVIHILMVFTHLYGIIYSGALMVAFLIHDIAHRTFRKKVYISILTAWLALVLIIPVLVHQSDNSARWFSSISLLQLLNYYIFSRIFLLFLLAILAISILLNLLQYFYGQTTKECKQSYQTYKENTLLIIVVTFMGVPIFSWIITVLVMPMLNSRYIMPTISIGWPIVFAFLLHRILPESLTHDTHRNVINRGNVYQNFQTGIFLLLFSCLLTYPIYYASRIENYIRWDGITFFNPPGYEDEKLGFQQLPIAMEAGHDFLPRFHYSQKPSRYFHILDWQIAINNKSSFIATGDYTHLSALNRHYPFINSVKSQDFLNQNYRFLVFDEKDQKWFEERIKNNPNYRVKLLGSTKGAYGPLEVFLVERVSS